MTEAQIKSKKENEHITWEATLKGHAGYAQGGPDIVCAAESVLVCTLQESVETLYKLGDVQEYKVERQDSSGYFFLSFKYAEKDSIANGIVRFFETGMALLSATYNANINCSITR